MRRKRVTERCHFCMAASPDIQAPAEVERGLRVGGEPSDTAAQATHETNGFRFGPQLAERLETYWDGDAVYSATTCDLRSK